MSFAKLINDIFNDYTIRTVTLGSGILGIISGVIGSFAVLRKQSLLGDTISHAALPGIALAFILTGFKSQIIFILGALIAGWIATVFFISITSFSKIKTDSAMGIILSSFFGLGIVLLTYIQKKPTASQAGIEKFLFGQAAAIVTSDLIIMSIFGGVGIILLVLFWKEFKISTFDPGFAHSSGYNVKNLNSILTGLIVIAIVVGLQTVGVVLMSAMIALPGAAARQWTDRLGMMVILAGLFGAAAGISGALISAYSGKLPTGPLIIIIISLLVLISILFAPDRGIVYKAIRMAGSKTKLKTDGILLTLFELAMQHKDNVFHKHNVKAIVALHPGRYKVCRCLKKLQARGMVKKSGHVDWSLTEKGFEYSKKLAKQINKNLGKEIYDSDAT